jgi:hypothetical protein
MKRLDALTAEMKRQNDFADSVVAVSSREAVRMVADMVSGEVVGRGLQGRRMTAGTGTGVLIP